MRFCKISVRVYRYTPFNEDFSTRRISMLVRSFRSCRWAFVLAAIGSASFVWAQSQGLRLIVNGTLASTSVRIIDGRAYAPISDVARALGMTVVNRPGSYEITTAGGANQ